MKNEIYKKLLYYSYCRHSDIYDFELLTSHDLFDKFMEDTNEHFGDCTKDACTCCRCVLQELEIEATRLYRYLFLDKYGVEKYNMEENCEPG